jgi:hypothetical protein
MPRRSRRSPLTPDRTSPGRIVPQAPRARNSPPTVARYPHWPAPFTVRTIVTEPLT